MNAVTATSYELEPSLLKIAYIMQDSRKPKTHQAAKISYVGLLPVGVAGVYFENIPFGENPLKVRFNKPLDFKRLGDIGKERGCYVMSSPAASETQEFETKVFNQNGEFIKTEPHKQIEEHKWFKLTRSAKEYATILEASIAEPETVSVGTSFKLRWPGKGPVSNQDALEILEQYRHEIYG